MNKFLIFLIISSFSPRIYSKIYSKNDIFKSELRLATILKESKYYNKSLKHYKYLTKRNHSVSLYIDLGILYKKTGEITKAQVIIENAIKEKPNNTELINALSDIYFEQEKYIKAKKYLIKIKNNKKSLNRLALIENRTNNYLEALKYYKILVDKYHENFQRVNLSILYQKLNLLDHAENELLILYKESDDKYFAIKYLIRFYKKYDKKKKLKEFINSLKLKKKKKRKMRALPRSRR